MYSTGLSFSETFTDPDPKKTGRKVEVVYKSAGWHSAGHVFDVTASFNGGPIVKVERIVTLKAARRVGRGLVSALAERI